MILHGVTLTPALAAWLRAAHDDGAYPLDVRVIRRIRGGVDVGPAGIDVTRANGSTLSQTEETEVRALLAAHAVEPLGMPREK